MGRGDSDYTYREENIDANKYRFGWLEWNLKGGIKI